MLETAKSLADVSCELTELFQKTSASFYAYDGRKQSWGRTFETSGYHLVGGVPVSRMGGFRARIPHDGDFVLGPGQRGDRWFVLFNVHAAGDPHDMFVADAIAVDDLSTNGFGPQGRLTAEP